MKLCEIIGMKVVCPHCGHKDGSNHKLNREKNLSISCTKCGVQYLVYERVVNDWCVYRNVYVCGFSFAVGTIIGALILGTKTSMSFSYGAMSAVVLMGAAMAYFRNQEKK